jgi:signal transduction histidine kinase
MARAVDAAGIVFERKGVRLQIDSGEQLPAVQVDVQRILRVFANLLDNALKFTDSSGRTVLSALAMSGAVRFCVANSGPALPPEALDQMFQPFWQAGHADRRGAGLGLSICRSIVEAHGGSIWAEPAADMRVRVCFLLPCTGPEPESATA